ncbi:Sensory protein [Halanaeroarchaeum sp. HSR-CO]|uniref:globin-coupled sensor protein n=1 Tax=Halanaeroarchaeum sp. HSR-CO TaxID=2866382 RepID=UPI00217EA4A6|nr:globin-coupled sensor protein [Halanaeroarchaeum sp. HSR-CO]UWG47455.1 Sensory protein [Halanaeroarchaeum sp. HSR-CO]
MSEYSAMFGRGGLNAQLDVGSLLDDIGLDAEEIAWRKDFINFGQDDVERLTRYQGLFEEHGEDVADMFYENLTQYTETTEVISRSPKGVDQLKQTQEAYLVTLAEGEYGADYFRNRARVGKLHDMLEMPMKQYIGQYGVYYDLLVPLITERVQEQVSDAIAAADQDAAADGGVTVEPEGQNAGGPQIDIEQAAHDAIAEGFEEFHSILKIINLDMQVVADTYIHSYTQEIEETLEQQQRIASQLKTSVSELSAASENVAGSSSEISDLAREQHESMDQVANEVSNLSATIEEVASSANEVERQSNQTRDLAEDGMTAAEEAATEMDELDGARVVIENRVDELESQVEEINDVIDVINDIADQTNLLALNANIEAARAGESGKGFAVVADEIKSLAEDTQDHADDIEAMIEEVRNAASETINTLGRIEDGIEESSEDVQKTEELLQGIVGEVDETVAGVAQISDATDEQAASAEEIAAMVDEARDQSREVADEIEDVAASTEEQAASIGQIEESAERLQ